MLKQTLTAIAFTVVSSFGASAYARDCSLPDQVTYCQTVGTSKTFDFDSVFLVNAISANQADFDELLNHGRFSNAKVTIGAAQSPDYSNEVTITLQSSSGSPFGPGRTYQLVLSGHYNRRVADAAPMMWTSSGVSAVSNP